VDVAWHDADFGSAWGDDAWAIGADEDALGVRHGVFDAHHVIDGDAFGDADDEFDACVGGFEDAVGGEGRGDKDHGGVAAGGFAGLVDGVEDGDGVVEELAAFAWGDACDDVGAVVAAPAGVEGAGVAGDALDKETGVFIDENAHGGG
jgi:hypothetical protein